MMQEPESAESFVRALAAEVSELRPILQEHVEYFDELIPHVFMGEVTRWVEKEAAAATPGLRSLIDRLEAAYAAGNDQIRELLTVSFLENLTVNSPVVQLLGPRLRAAYDDLAEG